MDNDRPRTTDRLSLGLDVGTQSLRAALVDPHGRTVRVGVAPIETTYPRPTWAEQDPLEWWSAAAPRGRPAPCAQVTSRPSRSPGSVSTARPARCVACDPRRKPLPPCPALDGSARVPRGRRDQRHRRPGPALCLRPGLARVDAAQGALAQATTSPKSTGGPAGSSSAPTG